MRDLEFVIRDAFELRRWDSGILHEVIADDCYGMAGLKRDGVEPRVVVDIGAHIGAFPVWVKHMWPAARMICVEALFENFLLLRENVAGLPGVDVRYGALVGDGRQHVKLHSYRLHRTRDQYSSPENTGSSCVATASLYDEVVPALTLGSLFRDHQLDCIDLLKLDCEGSELDLLQGATDLLPRIDRIRGEWHRPQVRNALEQLLEPTHVFTSTFSDAAPGLGMFSADRRSAQTEY